MKSGGKIARVIGRVVDFFKIMTDALSTAGDFKQGSIFVKSPSVRKPEVLEGLVKALQMNGFRLGYGTVEIKEHGLKTIERVTKGTIDISLGGLSSTVNRGLQVRFTGPYILVTPAGLLNRLKIPEESASIDFPKRQINSLRDIQIPGKLVVGVRAGSTNEQILKADAKFSTFHIETFATNLDILTALDKNQIDLLVADDIWIRSALKNRPDIVSRFQPILGPYSEEHLSIAVPPGDAEYWMLIDFMVKEYRRTGVITQILERYIDVTRDVR